jgi:hypothetical protein
MGAAVTYLVGTIAFYDKLDLLGWAICLLPFPLVCIAAFHALLLNLAAVRARSILTHERAHWPWSGLVDGNPRAVAETVAGEREQSSEEQAAWNR